MKKKNQLGQKPSKSKVSVKEYAEKHNPMRTRRGKKMSVSYLYRLIRHDLKGTGGRAPWFEYVLEGEKDNVYILI